MRLLTRLCQVSALGLLCLIVARAWAPQIAPVVPAFDPAFLRLPAHEIASLPEASRWDQPMGSEHGALTYNAQPFRITRHLGDDLNGIGGYNSDLGDAVYAAAAGKVVYRGLAGRGWGNMLIVAHRVRDAKSGEWQVVQSVYAHLEDMAVAGDAFVQRGQQIGTVGTASGQYLAHLHFEIRLGPYVFPSVGYADAPLNRVSPATFIREHRGAPDDQLDAAR
jgi:murein DD-endopeptidase MepM/ murein hydrolase activator NlpD